MNRRQFETEFRKLYLPLGMYALRYVGDTDSAEDILCRQHFWGHGKRSKTAPK